MSCSTLVTKLPWSSSHSVSGYRLARHLLSVLTKNGVRAKRADETLPVVGHPWYAIRRYTPLRLAAWKGTAESVKACLEVGADVGVRDYMGYSILCTC